MRQTRLPPNTRLVLVLFVSLAASAAVTWTALRPAEADQPFRSIAELGHVFWIQIAVGFGALSISGWVWALRPRDTATRLFALSGLATMAFTYAPIPWRFGIAPLSDDVVTALSMTNSIGASGFGIAMIALFLIYPGRLPARRILAIGSSLVFGLWTLLALAGVPRGGLTNVHTITVLEMLAICLAAGAQVIVTGRDPRARAVAVWFGLAVLFGAGGFITMTAIPAMLGHEPIIKAHYSFAFFLLIYIGVAAGLRRYRLFDLGDWAFRLLFYAAGALILLAVDGVLISVVSVEPGPAFALALLAVAFVYLPLRDIAAQRILPRPGLREDELFRAVVDIAFGASDRTRNQRWRTLLDRLFEPLEIVEDGLFDGEPEIRQDGVEMRLPALTGHPGLTLRYPWRGRALFSPRHLETARRLIELMAHAEKSRRAYDLGVAEERSRIARDMHDNIGAQLLCALHSGDRDRKDLMIRETLTDLRDIINNAATPGIDLDETLAELRVETAERLSAVGIGLDWSNQIDQAPDLSTPATHGLRSIIREAVSNVMRHSGASRLSLALRRAGGMASLEISDNGHGFDPASVTSGNGLSNMQSRTAGLGGQLEYESSAAGTRIRVSFPLDTPPGGQR